MVECSRSRSALAGSYPGARRRSALLRDPTIAGSAGAGFWSMVLAVWLAAGLCVMQLASKRARCEVDAPRARSGHPAVVRGCGVLSLGSAGAWLRRVAGDHAGAERGGGEIRRIVADPRAGFRPDLHSRRLDRIRHRLRGGSAGRDCRATFFFSRSRSASARQFLFGIAARRGGADHGDVVRLRLALEGRRRRARDILPDVGEYARRIIRIRAYGARPDALLWRGSSADPDETLSAGGIAVHLQRA